MTSMSKLKQLSRLAIELSHSILSTGCTGANIATGTGSTNTGNDPHLSDVINESTIDGRPGDHLGGDGYQELQTIKHQTTFERSKLIFCSRHLSTDTELGVADGVVTQHGGPVGWTRAFDPVYVTCSDDGDSCGADGNVDFSLRSLNGPCGIWHTEEEARRGSVGNRNPGIDQPVSEPLEHCALHEGDHLRYYVMRSSAGESMRVWRTDILVTRTHRPHLVLYNPLSPGGPWYVMWNQERGVFVHFVKRSTSTENNLPEATVRFYLDASVLGRTKEQRQQFARETVVSFSECQPISEGVCSLVDNHVTTGPLRVILASGCYRWPGGVVLCPSGAFCPERIISRYHAFHARVSREVLVSRVPEATSGPGLLDKQAMPRIQSFLKGFRLATYRQVEALSLDHPEVVSDMRAFLLELSSGIDQLQNLHSLKRALQAFVLFLASNCLSVDVVVNTSRCETHELHDFEALYRFVLELLPDRKSHQVFRDCIGGRIAMAIDST